MADPVTVNRNFAQPTRGSDVGTWDLPLNGNFGLLDTIVGGVTSISTTGGSNILTPSQLAGGTILVTGALTAVASLNFPSGLQGWWSIYNSTTGAFNLIVSAGSAIEFICVPQGQIIDIQVNGNSVKFRNLGIVGTYVDYAGTAVPPWVAGCTIPPFILCNGGAFSAATYPYLAALIGTNVPDLRGRARYALNGGTNRVTAGGSGIDGNTLFSGGGNEVLQSHAHIVSGNTDVDSPDHAHNFTGGGAVTVGASSVGNGNASPGAAGPAISIGPFTLGANVRHTHAISLTSGTTGAGGSQNMPPAIISGITMIRAA